LICLISQPILIASRRDWYQSKGLFKGFKLTLRPWESSKNWWRYGRMKFVTLVVVDRLTKIVHFIPTTEKTTAEELARLFRDNV